MAKAILFGSWALIAGLLAASAFREGVYWAAAIFLMIGVIFWLQEKLLSRWIDYPTPKDIFERHPARETIDVRLHGADDVRISLPLPRRAAGVL